MQQDQVELDKCGFQLISDPANERLLMSDYYGEVTEIINFLGKKAEETRSSKVICYIRPVDLEIFLANGFLFEALFKWYYAGEDAYVLCRFYGNERHNVRYAQEENELILQVQQQPIEPRKHLPDGFTLRQADLKDASQLSQLYDQCFQIYPTPLKEMSYIEHVMQKGTPFYVVVYDGQVVSAASADLNLKQKNAELTDCATLPAYRQYGLMRNLLHILEREMAERGLVSVYSLARALSFGMNKALYQEGYQYTGRLCMNCYIYDKLEDMNLWVKRL